MSAFAAVAACVVTVGIATAATPVSAADEGSERATSRSWNPFFEQLRPVASVDARRVIIVFDDPSLGAWSAAGVKRMSDRQQRAWLRSARALQQQRLDLLAGAGVQFQIEHRYLRVINGASIVVHGDGAQLLRSARGVKSVVPVRTLWPAAIDEDGAAGAAAAAGAAPASEASGGAIRVAVLDTGIDANHPAVAGHVGAAFDAIPATPAKQPNIPANGHGTAVAGTVLRGAGEGADVELLPIQVLAKQPARDGVETVLGDSDDLLAGLEHAVDPNGDGSVADAAQVAVVAASSPYAGFAGSPEDEAVRSADALGTVVVAAAGNDGASGDDVGTIGSVAASDAALAVGAVDLRGTTPAAHVRVHGSGIDETFEDAPVLTAGSAEMPDGELAIAVVDAAGGEVVDYLDSDLRSRVTGKVALLTSRDGVTIAAQVRAAADAGAIAVLVAAGGADAAAGTIDVRGADIPAIGLDPSDAASLREAVAGGERLAITLQATSERNPAFGTVAGVSSAGPRLDGVGRPDLVAPGVGMTVAGDGGSWRVASGTSISAGWAAGAAAAVRGAHPDWDAGTVRAALLGTARPLGEVGDRPGVRLQGAGLVDAVRAAGASWIAGSGRIEFGSVAPGSEARQSLRLAALGGSVASSDAKILLDDGGAVSGVTPLLDGDELVLAVAGDAKDGHVGGWLVLPDHDLRIPWSATIRDASATTVPLRTELSTRTLRPVAGPGAFASTLTLSIGGDSDDGSLGLAAVQRLEVRLVDASGKDRGAIGGLDQALPGIYTFGLTGIGPDGKRLRAGVWQLKVRYVPAADPDGEWRDGPIATIAVQAAPRAK
jgi:hypothetical protein